MLCIHQNYCLHRNHLSHDPKDLEGNKAPNDSEFNDSEFHYFTYNNNEDDFDGYIGLLAMTVSFTMSGLGT